MLWREDSCRSLPDGMSMKSPCVHRHSWAIEWEDTYSPQHCALVVASPPRFRLESFAVLTTKEIVVGAIAFIETDRAKFLRRVNPSR